VLESNRFEAKLLNIAHIHCPCHWSPGLPPPPPPPSQYKSFLRTRELWAAARSILRTPSSWDAKTAQSTAGSARRQLRFPQPMKRRLLALHTRAAIQVSYSILFDPIYIIISYSLVCCLQFAILPFFASHFIFCLNLSVKCQVSQSTQTRNENTLVYYADTSCLMLTSRLGY
jgi:hypothetical protein